MVLDTSEQCRTKLNELLKKYTYLKDGVGHDYNYTITRNLFIDTIMRQLQNNISYVCFDMKLSFGQSGDRYNLFTEIANAISGRSVTLKETTHGYDRVNNRAKSYAYSWDVAPYKCKFFTKNRNNSYLTFYMEITNDDLNSGADTDSEHVSSMFTILQNIHDRVTRLESSLPSTRPSIACPRRLE